MAVQKKNPYQKMRGAKGSRSALENKNSETLKGEKEGASGSEKRVLRSSNLKRINRHRHVEGEGGIEHNGIAEKGSSEREITCVSRKREAFRGR